MSILIVMGIAAAAIVGGLLWDRRRMPAPVCTCGDGELCAIHDAMRVW